jgi:hypothetical protein
VNEEVEESGQEMLGKREYVNRLSSIFIMISVSLPVTVAERSRACTVFARSEAGIVGSNPKQGMNIWCVYAFILCLCCPVFR